MSIVILSFFLIYGLMHAYAFLKVRAAFALGKKGFFLVAFLLFMMTAPVLVRFLERGGLDVTARLLAFAGYVWMGLLFLFVCIALVVDLARLLVWLLWRAGRRPGRNRRTGARAALFLPLLAASLLVLYGFYENKDIRTEKVVLRSDKIPAALGAVRIVQLSDVHLGLLVRHDRLRKILAAVQQAAPDMVVCTGDLVDGQINSLAGLAEMLADVRPRYGKFAVTGNHEFYAGLDQSLAFISRAGFTILRGEGTTVADCINIAGVDDRTGVMMGLSRPVSERKLLKALPAARYTVLLKHRPLVATESEGLFDLQLSGHTHKGQIFPFNLVTWLYYPVHAGILNPVDGCYLFVSRGSGTWGPPFRILSPPEVVVIDLVHGTAEREGLRPAETDAADRDGA